MSRRYGESITVTLRGEQPASFVWRGSTYRVKVIGHWRLATRWWDSEHTANRHYYRVMTANFAVFELYEEQSSGAWVLDKCLD